MANVQMRFNVAAIIGDESGIVRIMEADGGEFALKSNRVIPSEVFDILDKGKIASVMVSVNFCNDVVRMWDVKEK